MKPLSAPKTFATESHTGEHSSRGRYLAVLSEATAALLNPLNERGALNCAIGRLHELFSEITGINAASESAEDTTDSFLSSGLALSPRGAARCMFHIMRTSRFLQGLRAAIIEAQNRFPSQTIHVLYAGSGPYATLAVPLTTHFSSDEVQFTLLDIHQRSLDSVEKIIDALSISAYVRDLVQCDAAEYRHLGSQFHIVITETMQTALVKEPQVAITLNLAPQLCENGIFIPEKIALDIALVRHNGSVEEEPSITELGRVFEITGEMARSDFYFHPVRLRIPEKVSGTNKLTIQTEITVFHSVTLKPGEDWLTRPTPLMEMSDIEAGAEIEFRYQAGEKPKLDYCLLISPNDHRE